MTDWNADVYDQLSTPQQSWGEAVLARLGLEGDETVIDLGCGTGRPTERVLERLPRGRLIAVDFSPAMLEVARANLRSRFPGRVAFVRADAARLPFEAAADVVFSTATFHWILDHDGLFARLLCTLRPGGRLVAQCGGAGNIAGTLEAADAVSATEPYASHLADRPGSWLFASGRDTAARLERAGFTGAHAWLEDDPAIFETTADGAEFLGTVVLRHHLERLPADLRTPFAHAVAERLTRTDGRVEIDYVRLNFEAEKPGR
jgi:trans-aconitate 2-methyltransferase